MLDLRCKAPALALLLALAGGTVRAQPQQDPDWPCVQRLVPELAAGQMWSGPEPGAGHWAADPEIAPLALRLADLAVPMAEVERLVAAFAAAQPEAVRDQRLALLFTGALETINGARAGEIEGIKRYARRQQALAQRIAAESAKLVGLPPGPDVVPPPELAEIKEARDWDLRVFEDRHRSLTHLCDRPVALEQRAFALARAIQEYLS